MSVNNKHNVKGSLMNTLALNNDYDFSIVFNNDYFGMPASYNWYDTPPDFSSTGWKYTNRYPNNSPDIGYAGGYGDKEYRYGLTFSALIDDNKEKSASLVITTGEFLSNSPLKWQNNISVKKGGDFIARFVKPGIFTTGNSTTYNATKYYPDWFVNEYSQGKLYEYGIAYEGIITNNDVKAPSFCFGSNLTDSERNFIPGTSWFDPSTTAITALSANHLAEKKSPGLYYALETKKFYQPVVYGAWEVSTVAGDLR